MARLFRPCFILLVVMLSADLIFCADSPAISPVPAPESGGDSPFPQPPISDHSAPASAPSILSPPPENNSPPAPPPSDLAPGSSPSSSPSPTPADADRIIHDNNTEETETDSKGSSGGLKGGQKAGIVVGVLIGAGVVGTGGFLYKKRQDNIRRSQYGYAARRELL